MVDNDTKKEIVRSMLEKGFLVSDDLFAGHEDGQALSTLLSEKAPAQLALLNNDSVSLLGRKITDINWMDLEAARAIAERENDNTHYRRFLECVKVNDDPAKCVPAKAAKGLRVVFDYEEPVSKKDVGDFVGYYNSRFRQVEGLLRNRQELSGLTSIARILQKRDRENVALIGMVSDKTTTSGGHVMLKLEDRTGVIRVLVNSSKQELFSLAKDTVLDEVVGITGMSGDGIVFCTGILNPDIPLNKELKKCPEEGYAIFLSDLHVGSVNFLEDKFT
jgi:DNA polymerase II small subunit/DNA polymerase delta subunit B